MYQIDFHKPLHIHFIGIGGISMSGLAEILLGEDFVISRFRFQIQSSYAGTGEKREPPSITDSVPQTLPMT